MTLLDRTKEICKSKDLKISELERAIGLSRGAIHKWKDHMPSGDVLCKAAAFLHVDLQYLLTGDEVASGIDAANCDMARRIEQLLADLDNNALPLTFCGAPMPPQARAILKISLESSLKMQKVSGLYAIT